jgi:crotonobetainyl-CoA:carnitine CoA-transferase CaiB-like acyl-CoA transferase
MMKKVKGKTNDLPLTGIRVTDFGQMWAGPHLSQWLAVMGAEVIKVETRLRLDFMRQIGIPPGFERDNFNAGTAFASLNYGKKSITLNMNQPKAVELARNLIKISDVVTENYGGPILERWGLGYEALRKIRPDIIYYAGSGYGRSGPHRSRPSYAEIVEAYDGSTYLNGYPGGGPATVGVSPWTDATQAMHGAFAIMAALYHRDGTGEGQYIDAAMIEGSSNFLGEMVMAYTTNGATGERLGNRDKFMVPHGCYRCKGNDEWVAIAVDGQVEWEAFVAAIGSPAWAQREEFHDEESRRRNQDEVDRLVEEWTRQRGQYEVMEQLQKAGVAAGASLNIKDLVSDPQLKARRFFVDVEHPVIGRMTLAGLPWRPAGRQKGNYSYPPLLGEHNDYVFGELLGLTGEEIDRLKEEKVIY